MKEETHKKIITSAQVNSVSLAILALVAGAFALEFTRFVAIPFVVALLIYTVLAPVIRYLTRKTKLPHAVIVTFLFLSLTALFALTAVFIGNSVGGFINGADIYRDKLVTAADWAVRTAENYNIRINGGYIDEVVKGLPVFNFVRGVITLTGSFFLVAVFLLFFFAGSGANGPEHKHNRTVGEIQSKISFYISAKIVTSLATGLAVWIILAAFKVELALMFGVITFLLNFIPTLGSIIAVILPMPVIFLQYDLGPKFIFIMALLAAVQVIMGIIEPKVMGSVTDLHPVTVIVSLVFWSLIWGVAGAFLAVPLTSVIQVILSKFEFTKPFAELMAGRIA